MEKSTIIENKYLEKIRFTTNYGCFFEYIRENLFSFCSALTFTPPKSPEGGLSENIALYLTSPPTGDLGGVSGLYIENTHFWTDTK